MLMVHERLVKLYQNIPNAQQLPKVLLARIKPQELFTSLSPRNLQVQSGSIRTLLSLRKDLCACLNIP